MYVGIHLACILVIGYCYVDKMKGISINCMFSLPDAVLYTIVMSSIFLNPLLLVLHIHIICMA